LLQRRALPGVPHWRDGQHGLGAMDLREKDKVMSRVCELTGKGTLVGNHVSHANNKTKRRFRPNLQNVTFMSESLGETHTFRVSAHGTRSVEHAGGLDKWLAKTSEDKLSLKAQRLKRKVVKAEVATSVAA
jgi:large subunit ribosomal protein L28